MIGFMVGFVIGLVGFGLGCSSASCYGFSFSSLRVVLLGCHHSSFVEIIIYII